MPNQWFWHLVDIAVRAAADLAVEVVPVTLRSVLFTTGFLEEWFREVLERRLTPTTEASAPLVGVDERADDGMMVRRGWKASGSTPRAEGRGVDGDGL